MRHNSHHPLYRVVMVVGLFVLISRPSPGQAQTQGNAGDQGISGNSSRPLNDPIARKNEIQASLQREWSAAEQKDPLFLEAEKRPEGPGFNGYSVRLALNWINAQDNHDGSITRKARELSNLYFVNTLEKMLAEQDDAVFLQNAIVSGTGIDSALLRAEMLRRFSGLTAAELDTPSKLWDEVKTRLPTIQKEIADEVTAAPNAYGWPKGVLDGISPDWENGTRLRVYHAYILNHQPADADNLKRQLKELKGEAAPSKTVSTRPS